MDIAVVVVGESLKYPIRHWRELLIEYDVEDLNLCEAVAECCCTFISSEGKTIRNDQFERKIGIDLDEVKNSSYYFLNVCTI